jgi:prophage DNA circulation protein
MKPYTTVTLGDFEFARFEVPENIAFDTGQALVVHRLIGGKRHIDAMGVDHAPISWSGWLVGEQALARARYLEKLAADGKPLKLKWSERTYTVMMQNVRFDFRLAWRIQYTIAVEVVSDDAAPVTTLPKASTEQLVNYDLIAATALAATLSAPSSTGLSSKLKSIVAAIKSGIAVVKAAIAKVSDAIAKVQNFVKASLAQIKAVMQPIQEARAAVTALMAQTSTALAQLGALASLGGLVPNPVSRFASGLSLGVTSASQSGTLAALDARLGRMQQNIGAVASGEKTISTGSTTLFAVAAGQYGDARAWTRVAQANGLTDPAITGISTLRIPAKSSDTSTGVLNA